MSEELGKAIVSRIGDLLAERKMTKSELSEKSGIPKPKLNRIVWSSYFCPPIDTIYAIAQGFDLTLSEFFNDRLFDSFL